MYFFGNLSLSLFLHKDSLNTQGDIETVTSRNLILCYTGCRQYSLTNFFVEFTHLEICRIYLVIKMFILLNSKAFFSFVCRIFSIYTFYALSFGVQEMSGSIYLNIFLLNLIDLPGNLLTYVLSNK